MDATGKAARNLWTSQPPNEYTSLLFSLTMRTDEDPSCPRNTLFNSSLLFSSIILQNEAMGKVHEVGDSKCDIPSSEPYNYSPLKFTISRSKLPFEITWIATPTAYLFQFFFPLPKVLCKQYFSCKLRVSEYICHFNGIMTNTNLVIHVNTSDNTKHRCLFEFEYITSRFILYYVRN